MLWLFGSLVVVRECVCWVGVKGEEGWLGIFIFLVHVNVYVSTPSQGCFVAFSTPFYFIRLFL